MLDLLFVLIVVCGTPAVGFAQEGVLTLWANHNAARRAASRAATPTVRLRQHGSDRSGAGSHSRSRSRSSAPALTRSRSRKMVQQACALRVPAAGQPSERGREAGSNRRNSSRSSNGLRRVPSAPAETAAAADPAGAIQSARDHRRRRSRRPRRSDDDKLADRAKPPRQPPRRSHSLRSRRPSRASIRSRSPRTVNKS